MIGSSHRENTGRRSRSIAFASIFLLLLLPWPAPATPDFAKETGYDCGKCHIDVIGGGKLTSTGEAFLTNLKERGLYRQLSTTLHVVRLLVGYLHMLAAIVWFGTIMYVYVLLKPAYASRGLPKGELRLGWLSMFTLLLTGTLLTIARMPNLTAFTTTRFGVLLSIKIALFLVMLTSAFIVTVFIGPKMRQRLKSPVAACLSKEMTMEQLSAFDGKEGRPAYAKITTSCASASAPPRPASSVWLESKLIPFKAASTSSSPPSSTPPGVRDRIWIWRT